MKFLSLYRPAKRSAEPRTLDPAQMAQMRKLEEDAKQAGTLVAMGGMTSDADGALVRLQEGSYTVADGGQAKGFSGFAILKANSREEAIEAVKAFLAIAGDGESELHQLFDT